MTTTAFDTVLAYHQATKHHFERYARSAGYMDWGNQPDPFRRFDQTPQIDLPLAAKTVDLACDALFCAKTGSPRPLNLTSLGAFLESSLGLSAWKAAGANRWSLRINPSSGNLHPTEGHLIMPPTEGLPGGVFHYAPHQHRLEQRAHLTADQWVPLDAHFGGPGFLVGLTTIFWRESWKYGERAYRYCNLDIGHALAAIAFAARLNNWRAICLNGLGDNRIGTLLGLDRTPWHPLEEEIPEVLCWMSVGPDPAPAPKSLPDTWMAIFESLAISGRPRPLSRQPGDWPIISQVSRATAKPDGTLPARDVPNHQRLTLSESWREMSADTIIRKRRSAVSFDARKSSISAQDFRSMMAATLPRAGSVPFGLGIAPPTVHLLIFAHRIVHLPPGLYLLARIPDEQQVLQSAWRSDFEWKQVWVDFPLWRLERADLTFEAMEASCHQEIAGNSAFAVAMLAGFEPLLKQAPYRYRHLHWECGMIGQILYLAAEACSLRGTGIGCFFDDAVHKMVGIEDRAYQVLYHFTIGHPIEDQRLATLPAYHHLKR